jgi:hypothetical protein
MPEPLTMLCITSYEKGGEFMRGCKRLGCRVFLLTLEKHAERFVRDFYIRQPPLASKPTD